MGKSGQRIANPEIIDRPELKSTLRVLVESSIVVALFAIVVCFMTPLVTAFLCFLGIKLFHCEIINEGCFTGFVETLRYGGVVVLIISYPKIIDRPELKSPFRYLIEGSITLFLWSVWVYWILPVLTVILWFFGVELFHSIFITQAGYIEFIGILKAGGLVVLIISLIMLSWVYYNYFWFLRRGERRNKSVLISLDKDVAEMFNVNIDLLKRAKIQHKIEVDLKDDEVAIR